MAAMEAQPRGAGRGRRPAHRGDRHRGADGCAARHRDGRDFLRIIEQIADWSGVGTGRHNDVLEGTVIGEQLKRLHALLNPDLGATLARERGALLVTFLTAALAERYGYLAFVQQRGVPEAKARQCLADQGAIDALVKGNEAAQKEYNIPGTPTFILNGKVLENTGSWPQVEAALKEQGLGLGDVVMMRVFLVAPAGQRMDFAGMMKAYRDYFGTAAQPNKPARSTIQVAGLVDPGWLVEIEVTAAAP